MTTPTPLPEGWSVDKDGAFSRARRSRLDQGVRLQPPDKDHDVELEICRSTDEISEHIPFAVLAAYVDRVRAQEES